jgi:N-acyl-D-glutamate deacylase
MDISMKKQRHLAIGTLLMSVMFAVPALAQDYDLVITNGRVMDPETNFDGVRNVGIKQSAQVI